MRNFYNFMGENESVIRKLTEERIANLALPILEERGLELVEIEFKPKGRRWLVRIFIDKKGGVNISDCEWVSKELERILDVEDIIEHSYILEVSSPGLTRILRRLEEFEKYRGKKCRIITAERIEGRSDFLGTIIGREGENVIMNEKGKEIAIPFKHIRKAQLQFEV